MCYSISMSLHNCKCLRRVTCENTCTKWPNTCKAHDVYAAFLLQTSHSLKSLVWFFSVSMPNTRVAPYINYFTSIESTHRLEWLGPLPQLLLTFKRHYIYFSIKFTQIHVCMCQFFTPLELDWKPLTSIHWLAVISVESLSSQTGLILRP